MKTAFKNRLRLLLSQGLSRHQLALALGLGVALGIAPLVWGTSLICILLAGLFRLNQVAVQFANYLSWPLQVLFFYPYLKAGAAISGQQLPLTAERLRELLADTPAALASVLAGHNAWALLAWALTAPLVLTAAYGFCRFALYFGRSFSIKTYPNLTRC